MRDARAMTRKLPVTIPAGLRPRLEAARLDLLALFRALDRVDLSPSEIPQRLIRQLFELDADYAEALWALDQKPGTRDLRTMLWLPWISCRKLVLDSGRIFREGLSRAWPS